MNLRKSLIQFNISCIINFLGTSTNKLYHRLGPVYTLLINIKEPTERPKVGYNCYFQVEMIEVILPFSDKYTDYDMNGDKLITYEEFVFAVLSTVNMADAEELREPFIFADFDGNS